MVTLNDSLQGHHTVYYSFRSMLHHTPEFNSVTPKMQAACSSNMPEHTCLTWLNNRED